MMVMRRLEEAPVVNPVDSMLVYSKEHLALHRLGVPHPETLVTENLEEARGFAQREQSTHDFYMELVRHYQDTGLGETLITFAKEEIYHKYLIEKEYDDVILCTNH